MGEGARIRVLPPEVVNRIAAGEVVERPASVVKELVENSLDAGAERIEIEVRDGGKKLIRVCDDGDGMSASDLARAFLPHATSKLEDVEDLLHIGTLGFRGEALASIGAVSRTRIASRLRGESAGHIVVDDFGEVSAVSPGAAPEGTLVEVADLFRRLPARLKFLKSSGAEMARVTEVVQHTGIACTEAEFRLTRRGRTVIHFPKGMDRKGRIARAFGRDLREDLIEVEGVVEGLHLEGLLGPPSRARRDGSRMLFFLNERRIRDRTLAHAARRAYDDLIFGGRSPVLFVFLTMDPELVDQNVHPAKHEVRFRNAGAVHSLVHRTLREGLVQGDLAHPVTVGEVGSSREQRIREAVADYLGGDRKSTEARSLFPAGPPGGGRAVAGGDIGRAVDFLQVRDTYIVLETSEGITILDQHALHERVLYDRIKRRYLARDVEVQGLLRPAVVELTAVEREAILSRRKELASVGVAVDAFGEDGVAVRGLPAAAAGADPVEILEGMAACLRENRAASPEEIVEDVLATLACRAAVKAGDRLGREEVADLLAQAETLRHSHTCPHGRPTTLRISYGQLERHFKRK